VKRKELQVMVVPNATITLPESASCAIVWRNMKFRVHTAHDRAFSVAEADEVWVVFPKYEPDGLLLVVRPIGELWEPIE